MCVYEVAYARPDIQVIIPVEANDAATVGELIYRSGVLSMFPEIDISSQTVGIFGRVVALNYVPEEGDRVEVYRALAIEPRRRRRERAARLRNGKPKFSSPV